MSNELDVQNEWEENTHTRTLTHCIISCYITPYQLLLLLFLIFSAFYLLPARKKLLYTMANPARGLLNREKEKEKKSLAALPHPRALLVRRKNK